MCLYGGTMTCMAAVIDPKIPDLINAMEAAEMVGLSRQGMINVITSGQLPARKVGRVWLLRRSVVERYARARRLAEEDSSDRLIS